MAYAMTKQGSLDNCITYEFICDTLEDMNAIENRYRTIGSVAVVLKGESGGMEAYIAGSNKQWNNLGAMGANGSSSGSAGGGLSIYICAQNEVSNGKPNIASPDETTIYLISAGNESGNLYEEYIYVNNNWEKFGASSIDLSGYAPLANPVFTGSLSLGRKSNTTVGTESFAFGYDVTASGNQSHAEGSGTIASGAASHAEGDHASATGPCSHAEGSGTTASGALSHAEGASTTASGSLSHAEGTGTIASGSQSHAEGAGARASGPQSHAEGAGTIASGGSSHAEGHNTIAAGTDSHVGGAYNIADSHDNWDEWAANTSYKVGDKVKVTTINNDVTTVTGYVCKTANSDSTFTSSKWINQYGKMNFVEIIGNGDGSDNRSNARAVDWDGNERLMGDLYVGCNANSTGGTKVARIPDPPITDGTYTLQATVASGVITYTWVAGA